MDPAPETEPRPESVPFGIFLILVGAYIGSRWGLARLKARSVALIFILVLFIAAAKLILDIALAS